MIKICLHVWHAVGPALPQLCLGMRPRMRAWLHWQVAADVHAHEVYMHVRYRSFEGAWCLSFIASAPELFA